VGWEDSCAQPGRRGVGTAIRAKYGNAWLPGAVRDGSPLPGDERGAVAERAWVLCWSACLRSCASGAKSLRRSSKSSGLRGLPVPSRPRVEVFSACTRRLGAMRPMQSRRQRRESVPREAMCAGDSFMSRSIIMKYAVRPTNHASPRSFALAIDSFASAPADERPAFRRSGQSQKSTASLCDESRQTQMASYAVVDAKYPATRKYSRVRGKNVARQE